MDAIVFNAQKPLKAYYLQHREAAMVTDHASTGGIRASDPFHSQVAPMDGCGVQVPVGVHAAVGGIHETPTPGDLLCAALAACQDSAIRMVANLMGVELTALTVRVTADVDVRGALAMDAAVPVGFQAMRCEIHLEAAPGTRPDMLERLRFAAERCCVVRQTLMTPPPITTIYSGPPAVSLMPE